MILVAQAMVLDVSDAVIGKTFKPSGQLKWILFWPAIDRAGDFGGIIDRPLIPMGSALS
jgi:hypothetical protein